MEDTAYDTQDINYESKNARVLHENLDGSFRVRRNEGITEDIPVSRLESPKMFSGSASVEVADRIMSADIESLKTMTRFYLLNKGTSDSPKPALLDQPSLVLALKTLSPTMHMKIALALSINILIHYGHNADLNNDGIISPSEWEALQGVLDGLDSSNFSQPYHPQNKARLVTLILR